MIGICALDANKQKDAPNGKAAICGLSSLMSHWVSMLCDNVSCGLAMTSSYRAPNTAVPTRTMELPA